MGKIELLAPVGNWEALEAAVKNGADAVYLGGKDFSARQYANNFDREELTKAVNFCHIRDVKVFITVNTLVTNEELRNLSQYLSFLYHIDVDAIIVQDLGVAKLVKDLFPDFELHASTQMSVHNPQGVKLLEEIGFNRVVLAREMSVDDIKQVKKVSNLDLEVFVHGALCVCYSGQCLMSSMIGGRSGNRGRCAQPCRLTYSLVNMDNGQEISHCHGDYLLSPRDLNTLQNIDKILDIGVKSLKVEGRMKRPEYVATVVKAYRQAIDQYEANGRVTLVSQETLRDVEQIFNRGFTKGFFLGDMGKALMGFTKPSNRGVPIGRVLSYDQARKRLRIQLEGLLRKGDGIEVWREKGDNPGTIVEGIFLDNQRKVLTESSGIVEIPFKHSVSKGSYVYKTSDSDLLRRARETYERTDKAIEIYGEFHGEMGKRIKLALWDHNNHYIQGVGDYIVQKAERVAIDQDRIKEQLSKLGDTPYILQHLKTYLDEGAAIPVGELNKLRRKTVEELNRTRENHHHRQSIGNTEDISSRLHKWFESDPINIHREMKLNVSAANLNQLKEILDFKPDRVYYRDMNTLSQAVDMVKAHNIQFIPTIHRIMENKDFIVLDKIKRKAGGIDGVLVGDLGTLYELSKVKGLRIYTDFSFNIFNKGAIRLLKDLGVRGITLSPELNLKQIREMIKQSSLINEVIIHGYLPLMVTKYCPLSTVMKKSNKQESCNLCRNNSFGLKDRLGMVFPIYSEGNCSIQILNSQKLCLLEHIKELGEAHITDLRIHFTIEKEEEVKQTMFAYSKVIRADDSDNKSWVRLYLEKMREVGLTKGHFFRGVQ